MDISKTLLDFIHHNLGHIDFELKACRGGKNNQSFQIFTKDKRYFLKCFIKENNEISLKLQREFAFLSFVNTLNLNKTAQPIASDRQLGYLLTSYLDGQLFEGPSQESNHSKSESLHEKNFIETEHIVQCKNFIVDINTQSKSGKSHDFFDAADKVTQVDDAFVIVKKRIEYLQKSLQSSLVNESLNDAQSLPLSRHEMIDDNAHEILVISKCQELLNSHVLKPFLLLENSIPQSIRAVKLDSHFLSPSDFGFHNAMSNEVVNAGNKNINKSLIEMKFFDFEYAGLDSLHKLVADFFCQPRIPVNIDYLAVFLADDFFHQIKNQRKEFLLVLRLTQLKWALILLNEFLPDIARRRAFSGNHEEGVLLMQLQKSKEYLKKSKSRMLLAGKYLGEVEYSRKLLRDCIE